MNLLIGLAEECFDFLISAGLKKGEINAVCDIVKAYARTSAVPQGRPTPPKVKQKTFNEQLQEGFL